MRPTIALAIACCTSFVVRPAHAQAPQSTPASPVTHRITFTAGVAQSARSDEVVSPDRFAGHGVDLSFGYQHDSPRATFITSVDGGLRALGATGSAPRENAAQAALHVTALTPQGAPSATSRVSFGADLQASGVLISHDYLGPEARTSSFAFGTATIGPALYATRTFSAGTAALWFAVPVAGIVAQPYAELRAVNPAPEFHAATIGALRAGAATLSFEPRMRAGSRFGLRYEYRAELLRYNRVLDVRELTQSLSIGLTWRGGAR